jgi:N-acetyl-gamma-glutamyl-phosphate reductase
VRVHVYGASGYAAAEAIALLQQHPYAELGALESASHAGEPVGAHFPRLRNLGRRFDGTGSVLEAVTSNDAVVLGGSHGVAKTIAPQLLERGARVVDLSGDFRLAPSPAVYGFPERYRDAIANAQFVANPGCYPTATLLATLPLARFTPLQIVVDAKSGITGAGRTPSVGSLFAEVSGDVRAYGLNGHRHEPEIVAQWRAAGIDASLVFTPHVVPIARGMLVNAYGIFAEPLSDDAVHAAFREAYESNSFVRLLDDSRAPSIAAVAGTNDAELHVSVRGSVVRVLCAIDNLGRGAAAQAIVNLNLMYGFPEDCGLHARALAC